MLSVGALRTAFPYYGCALLFGLVNSRWRAAVALTPEADVVKAEVMRRCKQQPKMYTNIPYYPANSEIMTKQMVRWLSSCSTTKALYPFVLSTIADLAKSNHPQLSMLAGAFTDMMQTCGEKCALLIAPRDWLMDLLPVCISLANFNLCILLLNLAGDKTVLEILGAILVPRQNCDKNNAHTLLRKKLETHPSLDSMLKFDCAKEDVHTLFETI